jgi:1,6-anhydro-N-acetylmuramate kinase
VQTVDRLRLVVANLQPKAQEVQLQGLPLAQGEASIRRLSAASMLDDADAFWNAAGRLPIRGGGAKHNLEPYETAFIELKL